MRVERVDVDETEEVEGALAEVLIDCVVGGTSVGFLAPLGRRSRSRLVA